MLDLRRAILLQRCTGTLRMPDCPRALYTEIANASGLFWLLVVHRAISFRSRLGERSLAIEPDALAQRNRKHHRQLDARWTHFSWPWSRTAAGSPALLDGGVVKLAIPSNSGWDTRQQLHHKIGSGVVLCTALRSRRN